MPTELAVTLDVARRTGPERLVAVFQPHRYSRTQALWRELGASLVEADVIVVTDVYGAAQDPIPGVTGKLVVEGVARRGIGRPGRLPPAPSETSSGSSTARFARATWSITMGCGDVWMLGDAALERIRGSA